MTDIFKALSDETRLRIISLLLNGEMCVCEIEECLGLTQSNASRHLTALKNAGFLCSRKHAQWTYYTLNEDFVKDNQDLFNYLTVKVKQLPDYEANIAKMQKCKCMDLCKIED